MTCRLEPAGTGKGISDILLRVGKICHVLDTGGV